MEENLKAKLDTHSLYGIKKYFKRTTISSYSTKCLLENCYICGNWIFLYALFSTVKWSGQCKLKFIKIDIWHNDLEEMLIFLSIKSWLCQCTQKTYTIANLQVFLKRIWCQHFCIYLPWWPPASNMYMFSWWSPAILLFYAVII